MRHDGVERIERRSLDKHLPAIPVAKGQPAFAVELLFGRAFAGPADIGAAVAPGGVHKVQPERRRPGADGDIDEHLRILLAQMLCDVQQRHEMRADAVAGLVPFERVHAVLAHELEAAVLKPFLVARIDKIQMRAGGNESHFLRVGRAFGIAAIAAERRNPDGQVRVQFVHLRLERRKTAGEFVRVLGPESAARIVPAVINQNRIAPRTPRFFTSSSVEVGDHVQNLLRIHRETEVIPVVVMQERTGRPGAFAFDIIQETRGATGRRARRPTTAPNV